ncbi:MAG TPA: methionyl-tRNA formyltransferase [Chloroflexi bacterium]|jgi:methionyl-tRNA formyltransferase|nr:methionyl-tRNA formyltransferase [Chloroflexota bacterium]
MVRAVFMGSDSFSLPVLEKLVDQGQNLRTAVEVVAVVTQPDRPAGRGRKQRQSPVKIFAQERKLDVLQPRRIREEAAFHEFKAFRPELVVVASYGQILPDALLSVPQCGCLNLHPSLLPKYRGPSPIVGPILDGEVETGTTLMLMSSHMDAGPIISQRSSLIEAEETAGELEARLSRLSADLLLKMLPEWIDARIKPREQDDSAATYTSRIKKEDGRLNWTESSEHLSRQIRAFNPWPAAFTSWNGKHVRILRARPFSGDGEPGKIVGFRDGVLLAGTGSGLLGIVELQLPGGTAMPAATMVRGRPELSAAQLGA